MSRSPGVIGLVLLSGVCAVAGNKAVTAIVVYPGTSGPAYVQAFDITINSKDEVFACPPAGTAVDNNNYKKQAKIKLATATSVERMPDGALALTSAAGTQCVVPANLKLEKNRQYKVAELAAMATLQGKFLAKSSNGDDTVPAEIKTGTYLQFVAAPDTELAEYLRASRGNTVPLLSAYLLSYPKTGHSAEARMALAKLIAGEAEQEFAAFRASPATAPDYTHLKNALDRAQGAMKQVADFPRAQKVADDVRAQLTALMSTAHAELEAYQKALTDHTPGYQHLVSARAVLANVHLVDPGFTGLTLLQNDSDRRVQEVEGATGVAEGLLKSGRQDDAYATVAAYRSFRGELPRVAAVIDGAFQFHRQKADAAVTAGTWEPAIAEFKRALSYKEDADTAAALKNAETQLETIRTKQGAEQAIARSNDLAAAKQFFEAYQVLDTLPPEQRALVKDELANLQKPYTDELLKRSDALLHVHLPIRGRADEDGARTAQQYLSQATELLHEDLVQVKLDLVNESIAEYYLDLGNKQYGKPRGLGSGLGWMFWKEAQRFKPDLPALRDQMTKFAPQYDTRAKLSVAVHVRDHTSRRDSLGYADQVADTIAAAIDNASLPGVKVVSRRDANVDTNDPNSYLPTMVLTGDILNHRVDRTIDTQGLTSHYRAGRREVKNPAWVAAKETYDNLKAQIDQLRDVQVARAGTMKKKELMETQRQSDALATKLADAKKKMDAVPETLLEDIIVPYNYTRHTIHLDAVVEIGFQLADPEDDAIKDAGTVKIDQPTSVVVLESVKSEDVDGVIASGAAPDDDQLLGTAERAAQASLVTEVVKKVRDLPPRVLADARARVARNDLEGAAERYILYLNSTPKGDTPERKEALDFLTKQFNLTAVLTPAMVGR